MLKKEYFDSDDRYHRDDGPAIIWASGTQEWYQHEHRHRDDGPAAIWPDGSQFWWFDHMRHREDGPAVIRADGRREWWMNGKEVDPLIHFLQCSKG